LLFLQQERGGQKRGKYIDLSMKTGKGLGEKFTIERRKVPQPPAGIDKKRLKNGQIHRSSACFLDGKGSCYGDERGDEAFKAGGGKKGKKKGAPKWARERLLEASQTCLIGIKTVRPRKSHKGGTEGAGRHEGKKGEDK